MHNRFSGYKLALIGLLSVAFGSCERSNGIVNNNVIIKPFGLFVSDNAGLLYNSNDGSDYSLYWTKSNDGVPMRAITTAANNVIFVKGNAFVSTDDGKQFNSMDPSGLTQPAPMGLALNQSMIIYPRGFERVYMAGNVGGGLMYSDSNGKINTWRADGNVEPALIANPPLTVASYTQLKNNQLWALDPVNKRLLLKPSKTDKWSEPTGQQISLGGSSSFYLSHFANTLIIADYNGTGVWYSTNNGSSWTQYTGLPANTSYTYVAAPFEQTLLVGTEKMGIYRYDPTTNSFQSANTGIESGTTIRSITAKDRLYKTEEQNTPSNMNWIFLATSTGVYRSQNNGQDWFLVKRGEFTAIY